MFLSILYVPAATKVCDDQLCHYSLKVPWLCTNIPGVLVQLQLFLLNTVNTSLISHCLGVKRHSGHHSKCSVSFEKHCILMWDIIDFNKPASICRLKRVLIYSKLFLITISMNVGCLEQGLTSIRIYTTIILEKSQF